MPAVVLARVQPPRARRRLGLREWASRVAFAAGCSIVCAVVLLRLVRPEILPTWQPLPGALPLSRRTSWPRLCRDLGWERRLDKTGWLVPSSCHGARTSIR